MKILLHLIGIMSEDQYFCNQLEYYNIYANQCLPCPNNMQQQNNSQFYCNCSQQIQNSIFIVRSENTSLCVQCPSDSIPDYNLNTCNCSQDQYQFNQTTFICELLCSENYIYIQANQTCIQCPENSSSIGNQTCQCNQSLNYYEPQLNECIYCRPNITTFMDTYCLCNNLTTQFFNIYLQDCIQRCNQTSIYQTTSSECIQCPDNFNRSGTDPYTCNCTNLYQSGFYSQDDQICVLCPQDSRVNTQINTCECLNSSYTFQKYQNYEINPFCKLSCQTQFIAINNTICISCPYNSTKYVIYDSKSDTCVCQTYNSFYNQQKNECIECQGESIAQNEQCSCQESYEYDYELQSCQLQCNEFSIKIEENETQRCQICGQFEFQQIKSKNNRCRCGDLLVFGKYQNGTCVRNLNQILIISTSLSIFITIFIPILIINFISLKC